MKLYHGVNNNTKPFELKINQDIDSNLMGNGVYFFDSYEAAKKLYANTDEGEVYGYELNLNDPSIRLLNITEPGSEEHLRLLYNKENSVDKNGNSYNVMIYPAHYSDVYAELLFEYAEVSEEEPSQEVMEYLRQCIKAGKVLESSNGYLVGKEFTVDNFHEIVIKDQSILDKLKRI